MIMKRIILCLGLLLSVVSLLMAQSETKKVALLDVVDRENTINKGVKLMIRTSLARAIANTPGYEGYDRVDIDAIQMEQDFQRTGMVSEDQIKRMGNMMGAAYVLVAEAAKMDSDNMIVTAKILDVETAKVESTDYERIGTSVRDIAEGCRMVATRLLNMAVTNPSVVRRCSRLFTDDKYLKLIKMTKIQERDYLGEYFNRWQEAKRQLNLGIGLMSAGAPIAATGIVFTCVGGVGYKYIEYDESLDKYIIDYDEDAFGMMVIGLAALGVGLGLVAAGVPVYINADKKMDGILQMATEQRGVAPYRTGVSFNIGNQPHGIGLGLRF